MRAGELAVWASSSRTMEIAGGTADSDVVDEDTTESVQTTEVMAFREPDQLADRRRFAPQVCFTYHSCISIFYALGTIECLFVGGGVNGK